jgi:hypothetical protein
MSFIHFLFIVIILFRSLSGAMPQLVVLYKFTATVDSSLPLVRRLMVCGCFRMSLSVINTALAANFIIVFTPSYYISPRLQKICPIFVLALSVSIAGLLCDRHFRVAQDHLARACHGAGLAPIQISGDLSAD